ncbi:MAG: serine hydrolase [Oscillospiraceae bacterium]|nr:serine hydrolase [Oscillospiraceae bacterium]
MKKTNSTFAYKTPESVGVSSKNVLGFIDQLEKEGVYLHSFAILKGEDIFAEGYRAPFDENWLHRMYSVSKTFTSMAVGLLVGDGTISLSDKVVSFFPDYCHDDMHPYLKETTIRDLLMMSTPFPGGSYGYRMPTQFEKDWVWTFFHAPVDHPAGTVFNYDTSGTYMMCAIVERVTGKDFLTFLKERALLKTGFSPDSWCVKAPEGYAWGGSGVECTVIDLARFARLVMNGGEWHGEQLLPADYVKAAVSRQIDNCQDGFPAHGHGCHGYGYQIWVTEDNTFSFLGMGTQLAICMPEEDMIFVCTGDTQGNGDAYGTVFHALWRWIKETAGEPLPEDPEAFAALEKRLDTLAYPVVNGAKTSSISGCVNGKKYILNENVMGIKHITVKFDGDEGVLCWENAQGYKELPFGIGKVVRSVFPQEGYYGERIGTAGDHLYGCLASGAWTDDDKFVLKVDLIDDYFGNLCIHLGYKGDELGVYMQKHAEFFLDEYQGFAGGKAE